MNIQIQAVNFNAKEELIEFITQKLEKLDQYNDQIQSADVYLKVENNHDKNNKFTEIILHVPGDNIVVKKHGQTFEECIDLSVDTLKKMIIKRKEKAKP